MMKKILMMVAGLMFASSASAGIGQKDEELLNKCSAEKSVVDEVTKARIESYEMALRFALASMAADGVGMSRFEIKESLSEAVYWRENLMAICEQSASRMAG